jgi:hypothetical protein
MHSNNRRSSSEGILVEQAHEYCYRGFRGQLFYYYYPRGWSWFNYEYASQSGVINRTEIWVIDP